MLWLYAHSTFTFVSTEADREGGEKSFQTTLLSDYTSVRGVKEQE